MSAGWWNSVNFSDSDSIKVSACSIKVLTKRKLPSCKKISPFHLELQEAIFLTWRFCQLGQSNMFEFTCHFPLESSGKRRLKMDRIFGLA